MAASTSNLPENYGRLSEMLDEALRLYYKIENTTEATSSDNVQSDIRRGIEILEEATRMVSHAGIFSRNEGLSDMATADIQYLLLPVLLGRFTAQLVGDRSDLIRITDIYYRDFLQRTNDYGLSNHPLNDKDEDTSEEKTKGKNRLEDDFKSRDMKLKQFGEKKKYQALVTDLKTKLDAADDSTRREYYISLIKYFVCIAVEELNYLKMEKDMLEQMKKLAPELRNTRKRPIQKPFQPIVITREMIQHSIFGAGYPSNPTMTVQEFYDKRVQDGVFPDPTKPKTGPMSLQEASLAGISLEDEKEKEDEEKETRIEEDDEEYLERKRNEDEYKDDHRRGWGNRANRS